MLGKSLSFAFALLSAVVFHLFRNIYLTVVVCLLISNIGWWCLSLPWLWSLYGWFLLFNSRSVMFVSAMCNSLFWVLLPSQHCCHGRPESSEEDLFHRWFVLCTVCFAPLFVCLKLQFKSALLIGFVMCKRPCKYICILVSWDTSMGVVCMKYNFSSIRSLD